MSSNFINNLYSGMIRETMTDSNVLSRLVEGAENSFILNHNKNAVLSLFRFLNSNENIFILNGFTGSGKSPVIDFVLNFVSDKTLVFKNSYRENVNLDDILLSIFKDFYLYRQSDKVALPRPETKVFSELINLFVKGCSNPMVFVFDSFEINSGNKELQKDILDFINWLSKFSKIKIIICSKTFKQDDLLSDNSAVSYLLTPLSKDEMSDYLNINNIKGNAYEVEELYKISRGHYVLIKYAVHIMRLSGMSLGLFAAEYKKSSKNFLDFLVSRILALSGERYIKLLLFMAIIRNPVSPNFILSQKLATKDEIDFLYQNNILSERFKKYYMKDHIKKEFLKTINYSTQIKVHKYLSEVIASELSLKPFDRQLFLSRLTMRKEIAWHKKRIEILTEESQKIGETSREIHGLSYLSYAKTTGFDISSDKSQKKRYTDKIKNSKPANKYKELSYEDNVKLNAVTVEDEITKHFEELSKINEINSEETPIVEEEKIPDTLEEFMNIAKEYENKYDFANAIQYFEQALSYTSDPGYNNKEPEIYKAIALCHKKVQNKEKAIEYFEKVYELNYIKSPLESYSALLSIGDIYNESFDFEKAKKIYMKIIKSEKQGIEPVVIRASLNVADIEINNSDMESALKYLQNALVTAEKYSDTTAVCECCFKYALFLDDTNNIAVAKKYYLRCIQTSDVPGENPYLSQAYTNLADLESEYGDDKKTVEYYILASEVDKTNENYDGLYWEYSKLAEIYKDTDFAKSLDYLRKSLHAAKMLKDTSGCVSVYAQTGDLFLQNNLYRKALKAYLSAKYTLNSANDEELKDYINQKIKDLKKYTGEIEYIRLINEIKKKDNVQKSDETSF